VYSKRGAEKWVPPALGCSGEATAENDGGLTEEAADTFHELFEEADAHEGDQAQGAGEDGADADAEEAHGADPQFEADWSRQ
jgi:hypothetical protein